MAHISATSCWASSSRSSTTSIPGGRPDRAPVTTADEMALPHRGMYVVADARGRGVGRQLLAAFEEADYFAEKVL